MPYQSIAPRCSRSLHTSILAALTWALTGASWALPSDVAGVKIEPEMVVADTSLQLNGVGLRSRGAEKLMVVQAYALKRFGSLEELLAMPGPKRLMITYLREMPGGPTGKALSRAIEDNLPKGSLTKLVPSLLRLSDVYQGIKGISPGDRVTVDWIPDSGTYISYRGKLLTDRFPDVEFFAAFMAMWIGAVPGDPVLRDALLGRQ